MPTSKCFWIFFCVFFMFDVLHVTSFDLGGVSGKGLGGRVKMNQCEKDIKLHSYEERLRIFMKKVFFWRKKKTNLWQSISMQWFLHFFCLLLPFFLFYSSFKVNLKVHYRNWRIALLLMPMRVVHRPEAVCASFFEK